ncbi:unnamed protein product [Calypogeia fissa]
MGSMLSLLSCCYGFQSSILSYWYPRRDTSSEFREASTSSGITTHPEEGDSSSSSLQPSTSSGINVQCREVNQSLYELETPPSNPQMQVLFFHGLQFEDHTNAHFSTWESGDNVGIWPQKWLAEKFPGVHVMYVSYDGRVGESFHGSVFDMIIIVENLISDLMQANIGQVRSCPVILVGHSVGGLVIKQICYKVHEKLNLSKGSERAKLQTFLQNVKGVFFYGTPHHGSRIPEKVLDLCGGPLLDYFKILSTETARLNDNFDKLFRLLYPNWRIEGVGESQPTKWGTLGETFVVPEASARRYDFNLVDGADHFTISKPKTRKTRSFYKLRDFLSAILQNVEDTSKPQVFGSFQYLPESIVGTELTVQKLTEQLVNVSTLGLVGMGGVGKTTLAKAIFNSLCLNFEYSCFVEDVKHRIGNVNDIKDEVWKYIYHEGKKVGGKPEWSRLTGRQLLLVLDDISNDYDGRYESVFSEIRDGVAPESRFIVTSREEDCVRSFIGEVYQVPFVKQDVALELFKSHAFPNQEVPGLMECHVENIVEKCEGLPLTLEVLGKYLKDKKDEAYWMQTFQALVKAENVKHFDDRLWKKLRPSYEGLGDREKQMFLDATTFFSGNSKWTLRQAKAAWRAAYGRGVEVLLWQTLVDMSLVKNVQDDESIKVQEQLQSLGQRIAYEEGEKHGKCRVWDGQLGFRMLQSPDMLDGKECHALRVENADEYRRYKLRLQPKTTNEEEICINIPSNALLKLKELHFFEVNVPVRTDGAMEDGLFPTKLVLLKCVGQNLFNPTLQTCLAILDLKDLENLPVSVGQLSYLEYLTITASPKLCSFPESFGKLLSLRYLKLEGCTSLRGLPESFGQLKGLQHLTLLDCPIQSLPENFGLLSSLNYLEFGGFRNLLTLPDSFGSLSSLNHLDFHDCDRLHVLPASFGKLSVLNYLKFNSCGSLWSLPDSFGKLYSLNRLEFSYCKDLATLPDSFGELSVLNHLKLYDCESLHTLPESFGRLSFLTYLELKDCKNLQSLPESFGGLSLLNHLDFSGCGRLCTLPESFGRLSFLTYLELKDCKNLQSLPESFGGLSLLNHLDFSGCGRLCTLPESFGNLSLNHLRFDGCHDLHTLPESFGQLSALNHFELDLCRNLKTLPKSFGELSSLNFLRFYYSCDELHSLPDSFGGLSSLDQLEIYGFDKLHILPETFGGLSSLSHLQFFGCGNLCTLPDSFGELSSLSRLEFFGCENLHTLPDSFGKLSSLNYLAFHHCQKLHTLPESFGQLKALCHLLVSESGIKRLPDTFGQLSALKQLEMQCRLHTLPESLGQLTKLQSCKIHVYAERMPNSVADLKALRYLEIHRYSAAIIPDGIKSLPSLQTLRLYFGVDLVNSLPPWLMDRVAPGRIRRHSWVDFQVQDGCFLMENVYDSSHVSDEQTDDE